MTERLKNNLIAWTIYTVSTFLILIPVMLTYKVWMIGIPISILAGFLFCFLNTIIYQLDRMNNYVSDLGVEKNTNPFNQDIFYPSVRQGTLSKDEYDEYQKKEKKIEELILSKYGAEDLKSWREGSLAINDREIAELTGGVRRKFIIPIDEKMSSEEQEKYMKEIIRKMRCEDVFIPTKPAE